MVTEVQAVQRSQGLSIASMVLGIVACVIPFVGIATAPLAVIFAAVQLRKAAGGRGMAITGLVLGIIALAVYTFVITAWIIGAASGPNGG